MKKEIGKGFLIGLLAPVLMLFIFSFTPYNRTSLSFLDFIEVSINKNALPAMLSLAAILNLAIFWLLNRYDKYDLAKGVVFGTFIYAGYIAWAKLM